MTYSITNVRRDNDRIIAAVNGTEYLIRNTGGSKYGSISLQTAICDGELSWVICCHRPGRKATKTNPYWTVSQVVSID